MDPGGVHVVNVTNRSNAGTPAENGTGANGDDADARTTVFNLTRYVYVRPPARTTTRDPTFTLFNFRNGPP